ncbi:MAG: outer membrane beta-barrel protein [Bacteroidales bacterium]|nr:outer membrane beta-barrel protein [Candidatus Physcousia equi]
MKKFSKIAVALLATCVSTSAVAQVNERSWEPAPYTFVTLQGGVQNTFNCDYPFNKTFTPTAAFSIGHFFSPVVGLRLNFNGIWSKSGATALLSREKDYYDFKYLTTSADVLVNLCTLFGKKDYYPVNLYFIGGLGYYHAWDNKQALTMTTEAPIYDIYHADKDKRDAFNGRAGLQLEFNLCKNLALNLEGTYNVHAGGHQTFAPVNNQLVLLAGLNIKFGHKKVEKHVVEPVYTTVIDTIWYDEDSYTDVYKDGNIDRRVFFDLRESDVESTDAQLAAVAEFLKGVQDGEVTITAYADKGTGNPKINMEYSKLRAQKTQEVLISMGVNPSMIKVVDWKGDTVQPYPDDNEKNRVSIISGHGVYKQQKKVTNRKFRTEERKVRVQ